MRIKKFASRLCVVTLLLCLLLSSISASAVGVIKETGDVPYSTFTYWDDANTGFAVSAKGMYNFDEYFVAEDIVEGGIGKLVDVCFDKNDNLYMLDNAAVGNATAKIIVFDKDFKFSRIISNITDENGEVYDFTGAESMFVSSRDLLYICDTEHARLLISDLDGKLSKILYLPESNLIPDELAMNFRPSAVTVDSSEYVYLLSDGSYFGAMLFTPTGDFLGFYGANTVQSSVLGAFASFFNSIIMTDERWAAKKIELPFQFSDLYVDSADFVYTATSNSGWGVNKGQIKRMSPGGLNTISSGDVTFGLRHSVNKLDTVTFSSIPRLAVNEENYIFTFDANVGGVYIYNDDCVLLNAFGGGKTGPSDQIGVPSQYSAIDVNSENTIALVDSGKNSLTIFKVNDYGKLVFDADLATRNGDYDNAMILWEEVLKQDRNSQPAYSGLARAYFAAGDYDKSMHYAKFGFDIETYSASFEYVRRDFLEKYINVIFFILVGIVAAILVVNYFKKKKGWVFVKNYEIKLLSKVMTHPGDVFSDVKLHNRGSVYIGAILIVLYYVSAIVKETSSGFIFRSHVTSSFNSLMVLVQTLGLVLLWTICNWAVCTLLNGKGRIREIFIVTSYALLPLIIANVVYTVASNLIILNESAFLSIFVTVMQLITAFILITGISKIHDYTFGEFVWTSILTVLGILIVLFLGIAVFILVQQTYSFFATIIRELLYR